MKVLAFSLLMMTSIFANENGVCSKLLKNVGFYMSTAQNYEINATNLFYDHEKAIINKDTNTVKKLAKQIKNNLNNAKTAYKDASKTLQNGRRYCKRRDNKKAKLQEEISSGLASLELKYNFI
ncbi:MAG: hypothetical protein N4A33_12050 [Bacteriovoracaceae bacterium]|jgi:hypothetical protein|nr:hypothetical protein [Bacteriovoracaceae bacterium]